MAEVMQQETVMPELKKVSRTRKISRAHAIVSREHAIVSREHAIVSREHAIVSRAQAKVLIFIFFANVPLGAP